MEDKIIGFKCTMDGSGCKPLYQSEYDKIPKPFIAETKHIRQLRMQQGITLRKFAVKCDITPTYLSKIEQGLMMPSEQVFNKINTHNVS